MDKDVSLAVSKECKLTNVQARAIFYECYKGRQLTWPQMRTIRKSFAYAYELIGAPRTKKQVNFAGVNDVWGIIRQDQLKDNITTTIPDRIPQPEELKKAFTTVWTREHPWSLMEFLCGLIHANDWAIFGLRSKEDVDRVKKSFCHVHDWSNGWQCTSLKGGRAKLCGTKKGTRPWKIWRVCFCPGSRHRRPPPTYCQEIDAEGNPRGNADVPFHTCCPLAALELSWQMQDFRQQPRSYGKWLGNRFGKSNVGKVVKNAVDWFIVQGAILEENRYQTNAGRKSLALWTRTLNVPYEESFQMHGDLWEVWHKNYEDAVPRSQYSVRTQSTDPNVACRGLRRFANYIGAGRKVKPRMTRAERLSYHLLVAMGKTDVADRCRDELPSDDEFED